MTQRTEAADAAIAASHSGWRLERHAHERLVFVDARGVRHEDIDVVRAFPVTAPSGAVSLVSVDGDELAWIESLAEVAPSLRSMLEGVLAQREFLPVITSIDDVSDGEPAEWSVKTDRGPHRFRVASADDIVRQPDDSAFVTDTVGMRYRVPSVASLDGRSRRLFEKML